MSALFMIIGIAGAATLASVQASQLGWPSRSPEADHDRGDARLRDLIALQDDLYLLDGSLAALALGHPQFDDFHRRAGEIGEEVSALVDRVSRHGRLSDGPQEERYGAHHQFLPARVSEIRELRYRIGSLRDQIEAAQPAQARLDELVIPAGSEIDVMLDSGLSSRWANARDRVEGSTITSLPPGRRAVIPAGAEVGGSVLEARSGQRSREEALLQLDFDSLAPRGGPRLPLRAQVVWISTTPWGGPRFRNGTLGALLGGVIGGMVDGRKAALIGTSIGSGGGILATPGREVDLPEGTVITLRLDRPLAVSRRDLMTVRRY